MGPGWLDAEEKEKEEKEEASLRHAAPVPAVLRRVRGGASQLVDVAKHIDIGCA